MKILILDDSKSWRETILLYFRLHATGDHDYLDASTVSDALDLMVAHEVDVITTDWEMPEGNGNLLLDELVLRNWERPVYIISASLNVPVHSYRRPNFHFFDKHDFTRAAAEILKHLK